MPIFEYECPSCGFVNEALVSSADVKPPACTIIRGVSMPPADRLVPTGRQ